MILKHNCSSIRKQQKFFYMSHSIISYLGSLNNEFMCPIAVYFWTKNLFLETWRILHLGSRNWQHTECRESPKCNPHKKLKSIFVLVMNWTEDNVQLSHFMLGLGRTYITINIIWILDKRADCKICATCHKTFWNSSASTILLSQEALKF